MSTERVVPPSMRYKAVTLTEYRKVYSSSIEGIEEFWSTQARSLVWRRPWSSVKTGSGPHSKWFHGGLLSPYENLIAKHAGTSMWSKTAVIHVDEAGEARLLTYSDLHSLVEKVHCGLENLGVGEGDWVVVYSPPSIEGLVFALAAVRAGAPFEPVFTGFSPREAARRAARRGAKAVFVHARYYRRGKPVDLLGQGRLYFEKLVERGTSVVVSGSNAGSGFVPFDDLLGGGCSPREAVVESSHPLFGLHSGYEDDFKPITHPAGGFLVQAHATSDWIGMRPRDTVFCTVWPGWITSVTYHFFGPLMMGSTILLYDGAPDWPDWGKWLDLVDSYAVTLFITTSGALRMMSKQDPSLFKGKNETLREIVVTAEPLEPEYWRWSYEVLGSLPHPLIDSSPARGGTIPVVNMFIQSEVGTFFTGNLVNYTFTHIEPGSSGPPIPGFHVDVVDDAGNPVRDKLGRLVLRSPWPSTPVEAPEEFYAAWSSGFYDTGDAALMNSEGYVYPAGRRDPVMKVSGYRLSPGALEEAAKAAGAEWALAVPVKDPDRFEVPVLLYYGPPSEEEVSRSVREHVGPIAVPNLVLRLDRRPAEEPRAVRRRAAAVSRAAGVEPVVRTLLER